MATHGIVGERHYALAQEIRRTLAQYAELKDIIAMLGLEQLSPEDRNVVARAADWSGFSHSPFSRQNSLPDSKGNSSALRRRWTDVRRSCTTNSRTIQRAAST